MFTEVLFTIPKTLRSLQWMVKEVLHICIRVLLTPKRNEILPFVTIWVDLESILLSEVGQIENDTNHMISLIEEI